MHFHCYQTVILIYTQMIQSYTETFSILQTTEFINLKLTLNVQITEWVLFPNDNNAHPIHGSQIESLYTHLLANRLAFNSLSNQLVKKT